MEWWSEFGVGILGKGVVEVVYEFDFSKEVVKVPLKFLPVKISGVRDEL